MKGKLTWLTGLSSIRSDWVGRFGLLSSTIVLTQSDGGFWRFDSNQNPRERNKNIETEAKSIFQINFPPPEESEKPLVVMKLAEKLITWRKSIAINGGRSGQKSRVRPQTIRQLNQAQIVMKVQNRQQWTRFVSDLVKIMNFTSLKSITIWYLPPPSSHYSSLCSFIVLVKIKSASR